MNKMLRMPAPSTTLDIDVLRSVVAIAEGGSIAAATTRVARTPAAISMQVKKLEETLGRTLFERTRQGMAPTSDGERLLDYARRMIDLNRAAVQEFSMPEIAGTVNLGFIDSFDGVRLTEVLSSFARQHPRVTVNATMGWSAALGPDLDSGALDVALLTPGGSVDRRDSDVVLHEEPLIWIGCDGGRAHRQRPVPLSVADDGCAWRRVATDGLAGSALETRIAYSANFDDAQLAAVRADLAVAPMPKSYLATGLVELGVREGFPPLGTARVVLRTSDALSTAAEALAARIAETYGVSMPNQ